MSADSRKVIGSSTRFQDGATLVQAECDWTDSQRLTFTQSEAASVLGADSANKVFLGQAGQESASSPSRSEKLCEIHRS